MLRGDRRSIRTAQAEGLVGLHVAGAHDRAVTVKANLKLNVIGISSLAVPHGEERVFAHPQSLKLNINLILRSLRSKGLEGWMQGTDSRPSFETRPGGRSSG
jgi:hypothetical protein